MHVCISLSLYIYIYIYTYLEREREGERSIHTASTHIHICIYVYTYMYIYIMIFTDCELEAQAYMGRSQNSTCSSRLLCRRTSAPSGDSNTACPKQVEDALPKTRQRTQRYIDLTGVPKSTSCQKT